MVPVLDDSGRLTSLQFIQADGTKRFLPGGRVQGASYVLGTVNSTICLAEGYATAASIHEATGLPVAVAFHAGNLRTVAEVLRAKYTDATMALCGDNDNSHVGQNKAHDAAQAINGVVVLPDTPGTDWNDIHRRDGLEAVNAAIQHALEECRTMRVATGDEKPLARARAEWPSLDSCAMRGVIGDMVRAIEPHSEADPVALLIQALMAYGSVLNRTPHFQAEADRHHMNLFAVLAGETSKGRKGTSWGHIQRVLAMVDSDWVSTRVFNGLSSGEGLIWAVRDAIEKQEPVREKGRSTGSIRRSSWIPASKINGCSS